MGDLLPNRHSQQYAMTAIHRVLIGVIGYCGVMGIVVYRKGQSPLLTVEAVETLADTAGIRGSRFVTPPGRTYVMTVFTDYQCPACRRLEAELASLSPGLRDSLSVAIRHLPLESIHPKALAAAIAADCAGRQHRFAEMHATLFAAQEEIETVTFSAMASRAGVPNMESFRSCMDRREVASAVRVDMALAERLSLTGTPAIVIGSVRVLGAPQARFLDSLLRRHGRN